MSARIYKPAKTAMQSGTAKTHDWVVDFDPAEPRQVEPLMGWT
jgi:NADH dehydrogenase